ncbi:hypothetical protein [Massilia varians]|uniref:hypothetical protein n=1 Tax=Massilia TaxID=149698 RepID=UPI002556F0F2|nr:hypothetical protein [Massilia varians]MDK6079760.1 hypothetical protein [Massilia varians]
MSTTAKNTTWNVTVEDEEGESRVIDIQWGATAPTVGEAASAIRHIVLSDTMFPKNDTRESSDHTATLLETHGHKITKIEKA